jgi:mannose-6-phosphate isomerase
MLYELQEYSDITYRLYDYGRLTAAGTPRELHIERSLDVMHYDKSPRVKAQPVPLPGGTRYEDRCLVACQYFVARELSFKKPGYGERGRNELRSYMEGRTGESCVILSSLGAEVEVHYGPSLSKCETLARGQTMVLPAALGEYVIQGSGVLVFSYVPEQGDEAWQLWEAKNG